MKSASLHSEWLSLIDVSGPFLAEPVLKDVFPQGLDAVDAEKRRTLRQAYDEWREAQDLDDPVFPAIHKAWIDLVLRQGLELDEDGKGDVFKGQGELPESLRCDLPERGVILRPDFAVVNHAKGNEPIMLVSVYPSDVRLDEPLKADGWAASPAERMIELCRGANVRLGLVTNGERWMFVDAPVGAVTSFASWYANLWGQEPKTLQAFVNLLGVRRFFVDPSRQLPAMLDESLKLQDEVTDALGEQVRRAVEVLIQSLDRANVDRSYALLEGVEPTELYEAALTVMMRIVFLLSAEERGLLLMGDERYEANYAVSTLRMQLRAETEEILERRWDAWSRLLAIFRAVYGGIDHQALRLPALGGSLFDPDKFPFLEGRAKGSNWKTDLAVPLPIDNRTVLLLLEAVQLFQGRTLSYQGLDVEQIGYVYEGLLERTVVRAKEVTLDLDATKNAKKPWVTLDELDAAAAKGATALSDLLKERLGSSPSRVSNDLAKKVDDADADKLLTVCQGDQDLRDRIRPYFHLLRIDPWGYPLVYPVGTFTVTTGADRRETGTHYTPKSLTEAIVKETLEPIAYVGPAEGTPRNEWRLKTPAELLDLKICDPAMGSGAFLVQVCRWLSERLVEAWGESEMAGNAVTADGVVVEKRNGYEPLRTDAEERLLTARRLIAERCLYGVDVNPLAVELAKLSIWLVTLAKGRPFGFLDHNLRSGDSLLGINDLDQLLYLDMKPGKGSSKKLFAAEIGKAVEEAVALRSQLRSRPIRDIRDVEAMTELDEKARSKLLLPELIADALIGEMLSAKGRIVDTTSLSIEAGDVMSTDIAATALLHHRASSGLSTDLPEGKSERRPFHWPLEFPEVFIRRNGGFDAFVGNPPFVGGQLLSGAFGVAFQTFLVNFRTLEDRSSVDLVVYFFLQCYALLRDGGCFGLVGRRSISEGKNRDAGLSQLLSAGATIYNSKTNIVWPGKASVVVHQIHISKARWEGHVNLNGVSTTAIYADLSMSTYSEAHKLSSNRGRMFQGSILLGEGFKIDQDTAKRWIGEDSRNQDVLYPFLGGNEINQSPTSEPQCWVIKFWDWPHDKAVTFPRLYEIVKSKVKPTRDTNKRRARREKWWIYGETAAGLYRAVGRGHHFSRSGRNVFRSLDKVLAISTGVSKYPAFTFVDNGMVYSNKLCILADDRFAVFSILSSDIHSVWAWAQKTSLGGDLYSLVYAHGNIFETYPFPSDVLSLGSPTLERMGFEFFQLRSSFIRGQNKGLTMFYNKFHDPAVDDSEMVEIRTLQSTINETVTALYGWSDIELDCGFHEVSYLPDGSNTRFTVSERARVELLKRLSRLNTEIWENEENLSLHGRDNTHFLPEDDDLFGLREGQG